MPANTHTHPAIPERSAFICRWFTRYARRYLARHFHALRVLNPPQLPSPTTPLLLYLNHPGWWDPLIATVLSDHFFHDRTHFAPIDAQMLERYRIFKKLGFFPVDLASPRRGAQFLLAATPILAQTRNALWVTAEGEMRDPRTRPVTLMPGIAHLAKRCPNLLLQPIAIEYPFWSERLPEALVHFGPAVPAAELPRKTHALADQLHQRLAETLDQLAHAAIRRDPAAFNTILTGTAGTGGIYQLIQRCRALRARKSFDPAHLTRT